MSREQCLWDYSNPPPTPPTCPNIHTMNKDEGIKTMGVQCFLIAVGEKKKKGCEKIKTTETTSRFPIKEKCHAVRW